MMKLSKFTDYKKLYPLFFTIVFVIVLIQYSFNNLDYLFFDFWQKTSFEISESVKIVLVTFDEESDEFLGEIFPYTLASQSKAFERLLIEKPIATIFLTDLPFGFLKENRNAIYQTQSDLNEYKDLVRREGSEYKDSSVRKIVLTYGADDSFILEAANYIRKINGKNSLAYDQIKGSEYSVEKDSYLVMPKWSFNSSKDTIEISFHRLMVGNFPKGLFKDAIVVIGPKYLGRTGNYLEKAGEGDEKSPSIKIFSEALISLVREQTIKPINTTVSKILSVIMAMILSFSISRFRPSTSLFITVGMILITFSTAYFMFNVLGVWLKIAPIILAIFVVYYIWVPFRAIEEYQTRFAIQEETKILKRVDNLKHNFISLMSHDLKTPVSRISAITENMVRIGGLPEKQSQLLEGIKASTEELNNFISSILDLAKIESESFKIDKVSKDVNILIEGIIDKLEFEAKEANIEIRSSLEPLYPVSIDVVLIQRVVSNIIENAIKYSHGRVIEIKSWDDKNWVYLSIEDDGVGISSDEIKNIFDKFYRVKNSDVHSVKGTGLGLYLVKYFIELHGGQIEVSSKIGIGTKFIVKLINV